MRCHPERSEGSQTEARSQIDPHIEATADRNESALARSLLHASIRWHLVQRANLACAIAGKLHELLHVCDRFLFRCRLEDRKATYDFLRLGERTICNSSLPVRLAYPGPKCGWHAAFCRHQLPGLKPFFDHLPHPIHFLLSRRSTSLLRLVKYQKFHSSLSWSMIYEV